MDLDNWHSFEIDRGAGPPPFRRCTCGRPKSHPIHHREELFGAPNDLDELEAAIARDLRQSYGRLLFRLAELGEAS